MDTLPAWRIEAGRFVFAELDGVRTLCLKAERQGKDHVNHFLVALEPLPRRDAMGLCYLDPDQPLSPAEGFSLTFTASAGDAQVGDVLETEAGLWLKLLDAQSSQLGARTDQTPPGPPPASKIGLAPAENLIKSHVLFFYDTQHFVIFIDDSQIPHLLASWVIGGFDGL